MEEITIRGYVKNEHVDFQNFNRQTYSVCSFASPGTVIIFNHFDFSRASESLGKRYGTEKDVENLTKLFQNLKFNVNAYNDLSKEDITKILNEHISTVDWENSGSIVLIVLTHGEENGMLWASDHKYHCSQLWDPILQCDKLKDKFKFIILQACRGREREKRFHLRELKNLQPTEKDPVSILRGREELKPDDDTHHQTEIRDCENKLAYKSLPNAANNLLIAHSTVEGCDSVRNTEKGTWYIQLFCEIIGNSWTREGVEILDLLMYINNKMFDISRDNEREGQTPSFTSYLSHSILYKESTEQHPVGQSYFAGRLFKGRAYIYYDKNHVKEAQEFSDTMNKLLFLPILYEIDHGDTALSHICKLSHKNDFYHENFLIIAVFTKCESIIHNNVPLKEIYNNFSAENCPSLAGRMKAFFFLDANYTDELDVKMDMNDVEQSHCYVTNHADFFICRGHSKEFLKSLNEELLWTLVNPSYMLVEIVTTAINKQNKNQEYSSNFESTLSLGIILDPTNGAQMPKYLVEEKVLEQPIYNLNAKYPVIKFTGRNEIIKKIITETSSKSPGKKVITISGMSGVGKTQVVSVFCITLPGCSII